MGYFECEMMEQRGYLMPEYFCKYTRTQLPKETAKDICMTCRHKDCDDARKIGSSIGLMVHTTRS